MRKTKFIDRKNRLDRLIGLLKTRDFWTSMELSHALQVSQRTLMRDLSEVIEMGIPIETDRGRGGGIRLNKRYGLSKLELNYKEIIDLILALATIEKLKSPLFLQNMKSIKDKIARSFPEGQRVQVQNLRKRLYIGDNASERILQSYTLPKQAVVNDLHEAFFEQKSLTIKYTSGKGETLERFIEPHYLVLNWPIWYIHAWDHLRDDVRMFRVDRILRTTASTSSFNLHHKSKFKEQVEDFFDEI